MQLARAPVKAPVLFPAMESVDPTGWSEHDEAVAGNEQLRTDAGEASGPAPARALSPRLRKGSPSIKPMSSSIFEGLAFPSARRWVRTPAAALHPRSSTRTVVQSGSN